MECEHIILEFRDWILLFTNISECEKYVWMCKNIIKLAYVIKLGYCFFTFVRVRKGYLKNSLAKQQYFKALCEEKENIFGIEIITKY